MVGEGGSNLKVSKGVTIDGAVTRVTPEGCPGGHDGRVTTVAVPGCRRCDICGVFLQMAIWGCRKWALHPLQKSGTPFC